MQLHANEPFILSCSESVCREHESHFIKIDNEESKKCLLCHEEHKSNDDDHFPLNKSLKVLIDAKIQSLDFGLAFKEANKS